MLRLMKITNDSPKDVLAKASNFFGHGGMGLAPSPRGPQAVEFSGGGGFVLVQTDSSGGRTEVDIQTREFEYDVRRFVEKYDQLRVKE